MPINARSRPEGSGTPNGPAGESVGENAVVPFPRPDDEFSSDRSSEFSRVCKVAISFANSNASLSLVRSALAGLGMFVVEPSSADGVSSSGLGFECRDPADG